MAVNLDSGDLAQLINLVRAGQVRDSSGTGNNVANPTWGAEGNRFIRLTDAYYADGASAPRTTTLSPRQISDIISTQDNDGNGSDESTPNPFGGSSLLAYFGQYFDHGVDFIAKGQSGTSVIGSGAFPLNASRGNIQPGTGLNPDGIPDNGDEIPAEYINKASPFADLSQVYGSDNAVTDLLREWTDTPGGPVRSAYLLSGDLDASGHHLLPTLNAVRDNYRTMTDGGELTSADIANFDGTNQALLLDFIPVFSSP
ncbi:MAG: peroxidase family protein, partial [Caulobacteraceae bacterium]